MTERFKLVVRKAGKDDLPLPAKINIGLGGGGIDEQGNRLVTPQLSTEGEVDYWVDKLIKELEALRKQAKQELAKK